MGAAEARVRRERKMTAFIASGEWRVMLLDEERSGLDGESERKFAG